MVSPAPIHWKCVSATDESKQGCEEKDKGRFRIRLRLVRHPIKEAILRIGSKTFNLDTILDTLADIEDNDEIRRSKSARKRLKEELLCVNGCYQVNNVEGRKKKRGYDSGSDYEDESSRRVDEFNAADFIKNYEAKTHKHDISDDVCYKCGKCGELVLCDGCPHAFHLLCVGLGCVPEDKWFCGECQAGTGNGYGDVTVNVGGNGMDVDGAGGAALK